MFGLLCSMMICIVAIWRRTSTIYVFALAPFEVSDLQHDGTHKDRCKAIWICATESGRGDQEACCANEKGGTREKESTEGREEGEEEGEKGANLKFSFRMK